MLIQVTEIFKEKDLQMMSKDIHRICQGKLQNMQGCLQDMQGCSRMPKDPIEGCITYRAHWSGADYPDHATMISVE